MPSSKGSHQAKRRIESQRNPPQKLVRVMEDPALQGPSNYAKAISGHTRTSTWMKQGKRDSQQR